MKNNKQLLSGNQAIALASTMGGVDLVTGYPGTPSTEIIDTLKKTTKTPKAHWAINEKVAMEMAIGSSLFGKRSICVMKHVGLNVAADALMTFSYTGVRAGCLIVSADDPNMFSSQNEQDNRNYAYFAKIPMLEPSDSEESFLFTLIGLEISEQFDTPVLLRTTTRVAHTTSMVNTSKNQANECIKKIKLFLQNYVTKEVSENKNWSKKTIMLPSIGRIRHQWVEQRMQIFKKITEKFVFNRLEKSKIKSATKKLLVTSGVSYLYAKEAFPEHDIYKISLSYPAPVETIKKHATAYTEVMAIEELDPFIENQLLIANIATRKRNHSFYCGELSVERVEKLVLKNKEAQVKSFLSDDYWKSIVTPNPPALCSGCPHLTIANLLQKETMTVSGDIGCYTLLALPPFETIDTVLAMGSSIGILSGMTMSYEKENNAKNVGKKEKPTNESTQKVAIIGDSTFLHAGIPALIEIARLNPDAVICLLDNHTTAMTGQQNHPGRSALEENIDYLQLGKTLGIKNVYRIPNYQVEHCRTIFNHALKEKGLTLIVFEESCVLLAKKTAKKNETAEIKDVCVRCAECLEVGCPSIQFSQEKQRPDINTQTCIGCGICFSACDYNALGKNTNATLFDFIKKQS